MRNAGITALIAVLLSAAPKPATALQQFVDVREVATDSLHDLAVTVVSTGRSTIYYSPARMQQVGPKLAAFAMAHEYGHVRYGHTGGALVLVTSGDSSFAAVRLLQELEADCYAARILSVTNADALKAAVQFFTTMGPFRFDSYHPSGAQRAAKLLSCLPPEPGTP